MTVYKQIFGGDAFGLCGTSVLDSEDEIILMMASVNDNPPDAASLRRQAVKIDELLEEQNWKEFEEDYAKGETPWA